MRKLLWVGDACCPSGFARSTHETLDVLRYAFDVTVLGINYRGDPHDYPYPVYAAAPGGDAMGVARLVWMCDMLKPDVIVLQNDPWNIPYYMQQLKRFPEHANIPVIASVAVDGLNCRGKGLNDLTLAVFWTEFGLREARDGGYTKPAVVIPLGVDLGVYHPMDRQEARERLPEILRDKFIVGNVNRNQPRKRMDLTVRYFADWVKTYRIYDAYLYLHVAPTGDEGYGVKDLAAYYGVVDRLALMEPPPFYGLTEEHMAATFNAFDVQVSTTQGEGFGLTTLEGMACGVPQIVPKWAALEDWAAGAVRLVPCSSTCVGPPYVNVIGGVADQQIFVTALDGLHRDAAARKALGQRALARAQEERFRWPNIGQAFLDAVEHALDPTAVRAKTEPATLKPKETVQA